MKRSRILSWSIALITVLSIMAYTNGASIRTIKRSNKQLIENNASDQAKVRVYRQIYEAEDSAEDSDEDDDEGDVERFQQNLIEQQQHQSFGESAESSDEDDDLYQDDVLHRRRRRQTAELVATVDVQPPVEQLTPAPITETNPNEEGIATQPLATGSESIVPTATTTTAPSRKPSVLILIRDALKKVTTELPTEQVASNALHYFQLFEHFLQQTIEQVIGDDYDEDEEATTIKIETEDFPELFNKAPEMPPVVIETVEITNNVPSEVEKLEQPSTIVLIPPVEDKKPVDSSDLPSEISAANLSATTAAPTSAIPSAIPSATPSAIPSTTSSATPSVTPLSAAPSATSSATPSTTSSTPPSATLTATSVSPAAEVASNIL